MTENKEKILETAKEAAEEASRIIMEFLNKASISNKGTNNLVTEADVRSEKAVREIISREFPSHSILGEENGGEKNHEAENLWIIDPLDGTNNYAHGFPFFSVSIGYAEKGLMKVGYVLDVIRNERFHAIEGAGAFCNGKPIRVSERNLNEALVGTGFYYDRGTMMQSTLKSIGRLFENNIRGIRRTGSSALDICFVAAGRLDAYFEYKLGRWDFAAGMLILREAGGDCRDATGRQLTLESESYVFSNGVFADRLIELVRYPEE